MRSVIFIFVLLFGYSCFAQTTVKKVPSATTPAPKAAVKKAPAATKAPATTGTITVKKTAAPDQVYMTADVMPEYSGGTIAMMKFISSNVIYPQDAMEKELSGTCFISFVVEKNGQISNVRVLRGVSGCLECDMEAVRVVKLMPAWKPGIYHDNAVRVQYNLPIKFTLR